MFELLKRDGLARICKLETRSGVLDTPALLPVINPRMITISPRELYEEFGFKSLITNSYIIRNDAEISRRALEEGLHQMLDFPGVVMTDSGTFQSHMYGEVDVKNAEIIEFQRDIGSDIGTVLDIFTEPFWSEEKTGEAVDVTLERTREATGLRGDMLIAGVVQGSIYPHLRERCAREMASMDGSVHPVGGVVPLMEQYRFTELVDVIVASKKGLSPDRPVHLFGAGHPMILSLASLLGCDMFDSASYAKFARDDRMMFVDGTMRLGDMSELVCDCPACRGHDLNSLRSLPPKERLETIARHNLYELSREMRQVRRGILEGSIWELTERRCRGHPALLSALRRLANHVEFLERFEPVSRDNALFYTGTETLDRPAIHRFHQRVAERYEPVGDAVLTLPEAGKPYSRVLFEEARLMDVETMMIMGALGPVPLDLDEVYPIAQSVTPEMDEVMVTRGQATLDAHLRQWELEESSSEVRSEASGIDPDIRRVHAVANHQFGAGAGTALLDGDVALVKSRNTNKVRNVLVDGRHVLSMRAPDGIFTLKPEGAMVLHRLFPSPRMRVIVHDDAVPFNREGRNVFCGFVVDCDPDIRPMEEVMVVDGKDNLIAIGRATMTRDEMLAFDNGVAVKVRDGMAS